MKQFMNMKMVELMSQPSESKTIRDALQSIEKVLVNLDHRVTTLEEDKNKRKSTVGIQKRKRKSKRERNGF